VFHLTPARQERWINENLSASVVALLNGFAQRR